MGRDYHRAEPVERQVIEYIEELFAPHAGRVTTTRQTCSAVHESLIIRICGESERPAALFESHMDTVPAHGWEERALKPIVQEDKLIGLGASDDKGSLVAMILALLELLEDSVVPARTIVLVCAGDEEYAQAGIRKFLGDSEERFAYGIFGEPTRLCPVVQHKGTVRWDITVHGKSAHTSRPELGINAISGMMDVIAALAAHQEQLQMDSTNLLMSGPTITVTTIAGGQTRNATPDECTIAVDFRVMPGMDPAAERKLVIDKLGSLPWQISHSQVQVLTPSLNTDPRSAFADDILSICRRIKGPESIIQGEPYGTDAAWTNGRCPSIVLGPGNIRSAHAVDEHIDLEELRQAVEIYKQIMTHPFNHMP
jgi:acetylornithine deacetylase